jgi:hypothetical protein
MPFVQEVARGHNASNSATLVLTLSGVTTTVGHHIILVAGQEYAGHLNSVADSKGNTWQVDADYSDTPGSDKVAIFVASCLIATSKALVNGDTITLTFSLATTTHAAVASEFSGLTSTAWFDKKAGYTSQGATATASDSGATATTSTATELLIGTTGIDKQNWPTFVAEVLSPTWSLITKEWLSANWFGIQPMYREVSSTGAYHAKGTWTGSGAWGALIATYNLVATNVTVTPSAASMTLTGATPPLAAGLSVPAASMTLTGATPVLAAKLSVPAAAMTLTGATPVLNAKLSVSAASMTLAGVAPAVVTPVVTLPTTASMSLSGVAPALAAGVYVPAAAMVLTGATPTIATPVVVAPSAGSMTLTGATPAQGIGVYVPAATLTLTGATPVQDTGIYVSAAEMVLTGVAPAVVLALASRTWSFGWAS